MAPGPEGQALGWVNMVKVEKKSKCILTMSMKFSTLNVKPIALVHALEWDQYGHSVKYVVGHNIECMFLFLMKLSTLIVD